MIRRHSSSRARRRQTSERGFATVLAAALVLPILGLIGLAIDAGRGLLIHERLTTAVRETAIFGVVNFDAADRDARMNALFALEFGAPSFDASVASLDIVEASGVDRLEVRARVEAPTLVMLAVSENFRSLPMEVAATAEREDLLGGAALPDVEYVYRLVP